MGENFKACHISGLDHFGMFATSSAQPRGVDTGLNLPIV